MYCTTILKLNFSIYFQLTHGKSYNCSGVASSISEGGIFIYSCSAQLMSFETDSISNGINCAEHEYMNMSSSLIELATPLYSWFHKCFSASSIKMYCSW